MTALTCCFISFLGAEICAQSVRITYQCSRVLRQTVPTLQLPVATLHCPVQWSITIHYCTPTAEFDIMLNATNLLTSTFPLVFPHIPMQTQLMTAIYLDCCNRQSSTGRSYASGQHRTRHQPGSILQKLGLGCAWGHADTVWLSWDLSLRKCMLHTKLMCIGLCGIDSFQLPRQRLVPTTLPSQSEQNWQHSWLLKMEE